MDLVNFRTILWRLSPVFVVYIIFLISCGYSKNTVSYFNIVFYLPYTHCGFIGFSISRRLENIHSPHEFSFLCRRSSEVLGGDKISRELVSVLVSPINITPFIVFPTLRFFLLRFSSKSSHFNTHISPCEVLFLSRESLFRASARSFLTRKRRAAWRAFRRSRTAVVSHNLFIMLPL